MNPERVLPDDPLGFIRQSVLENRLYWTYHVTMRMEKRSIPSQIVRDSVESYEVIEAYPDDQYLPSYLIYARHGGMTFHVLFAADVPGKNVRIVTAYQPNPHEWEADFKRRKKP